MIFQDLRMFDLLKEIFIVSWIEIIKLIKFEFL